LELSGFVSANYLFTDSVSVLKLESDPGLNIFCLLPGYALNNKVHDYTISSKVIVTGECIGIKDMFNLSGVFVKVFSLKSADR